MNKIKLIMTAVLLAAGTGYSDVLFSEDYDAGNQVIGEIPTNATVVRPVTPQPADNHVWIVGSAQNISGTGNAVEFYKAAGSAAAGGGLEYNFVASSNDQKSAVRIDFSFSPVTIPGPGTHYLSFSAAKYVESSSQTLGSSASRYAETRFYDNGRCRMLANGVAVDSNIVAGTSNTLTAFINDYDSKSIIYTGPDSVAHTLPANGLDWWLNGTLRNSGSLNTGMATPNGTVGNTENNFGRMGFAETSSYINLHWTFDNLKVSDIVAPSGSGDLRLYLLGE